MRNEKQNKKNSIESTPLDYDFKSVDWALTKQITGTLKHKYYKLTLSIWLTV